MAGGQTQICLASHLFVLPCSRIVFSIICPMCISCLFAIKKAFAVFVFYCLLVVEASPNARYDISTKQLTPFQREPHRIAYSS